MSDIKEKVLDIINSCIEGANVTLQEADMELSQFGMDSLHYIRIVVQLEEEFAKEIPNEYLTIEEMSTINKITSIIEKIINDNMMNNE